MKTDLEIAQSVPLKPIEDIAAKIGLKPEDIERYGSTKAKIKMDVVTDPKRRADGKVILVTAITPTPAGEGKSTTTIGLGDALNRLGHPTTICIREPSLGPVMGIKGGAAGGGYAQVVPMEDINLHFTGDIHAITAANNLISAVIDNHLYHGNELQIDKDQIFWKRAMDMNDRALRQIQVGMSSKKEHPRQDGFNITVASEIMAVLCLSKDMDDLKARVARIVLASNTNGDPITVRDLKIQGAVATLLKDAIKPNLVQTLESNPVLIHGGPFANIAHGCNSVIATDFARKISRFVVTEAGFGADLGMEKFMDIKARVLGVMPSAVVIVASIRALKLHGGASKNLLKEENIEALALGIQNLEKHIESVGFFHVPYVVALNRFGSDTSAEIEWVQNWAMSHNVPLALSEVFAKGSEGGIELANQLLEVLSHPAEIQAEYLYDLSLPIKEKVEVVAKKMYGASSVIFSELALSQISSVQSHGWDQLPICMAKTPLSLSDNPKLLGRPKDFSITIREFRLSIGAGFIVVLTGEVMTMPGLPKQGAFENMDVIDDRIVGLF
ncbi:MAG: formate--tetrahydrofolate ligase [Candidatus Izemoplasmatales bacterium]|jgi:formate--tetrahydrofolate ligase|nr:formate--tetrahydrofolate ligase [Candidatus Izemoplasmatales bacterium]MDY0372819.1 formate--tetrahydrofolate ligase [Candidatus Izemoplasmatales bacterium]